MSVVQVFGCFRLEIEQDKWIPNGIHPPLTLFPIPCFIPGSDLGMIDNSFTIAYICLPIYDVLHTYNWYCYLGKRPFQIEEGLQMLYFDRLFNLW